MKKKKKSSLKRLAKLNFAKIVPCCLSQGFADYTTIYCRKIVTINWITVLLHVPRTDQGYLHWNVSEISVLLVVLIAKILLFNLLALTKSPSLLYRAYLFFQIYFPQGIFCYFRSLIWNGNSRNFHRANQISCRCYAQLYYSCSTISCDKPSAFSSWPLSDPMHNQYSWPLTSRKNSC